MCYLGWHYFLVCKYFVFTSHFVNVFISMTKLNTPSFPENKHKDGQLDKIYFGGFQAAWWKWCWFTDEGSWLPVELERWLSTPIQSAFEKSDQHKNSERGTHFMEFVHRIQSYRWMSQTSSCAYGHSNTYTKSQKIENPSLSKGMLNLAGTSVCVYKLSFWVL